jgi:hypothetical protein
MRLKGVISLFWHCNISSRRKLSRKIGLGRGNRGNRSYRWLWDGFLCLLHFNI